MQLPLFSITITVVLAVILKTPSSLENVHHIEGYLYESLINFIFVREISNEASYELLKH
jgi:hypothetical protein